MSTRTFRAYLDPDDSRSAGALTFTASTEGVKRDGLDMRMDGAQVDNYRRNPVVLWAHDYFGTRPPIGRADVTVLKSKMKARVEFDEADPFAAEIARKYRDGYLHAVSIGWDVLDYDEETRTVTKWDLLDISAVPVPGDPDALIQRTRTALQDLARDLDPHASPVDITAVGDTERRLLQADGSVITTALTGSGTAGYVPITDETLLWMVPATFLARDIKALFDGTSPDPEATDEEAPPPVRALRDTLTSLIDAAEAVLADLDAADDDPPVDSGPVDSEEDDNDPAGAADLADALAGLADAITPQEEPRDE